MEVYVVTAIGSFSAYEVISSIRRNRPLSRIVGINSLPHENSCLVDAFYIVPFAKEDLNYLERVFEICIIESVNKILVLTDVEIDVFNKQREIFNSAGVDVCISSEDSILIARDKYIFYLFFQGLCVDLIPSIKFEDFNGEFDCVVIKPRSGRSSEGVFYIKNINEISNYRHLKSLNYLVQPCWEGDIYTVDVVRNSKTNSVVSIPRLEIERSERGAGLKVAIKNDLFLRRRAEEVCCKIGYNGCLNLEFLYRNGKFFLMDINPRFSAGVGFSKKAGYDFVENHIRCFENSEIDACLKIEESVFER